MRWFGLILAAGTWDALPWLYDRRDYPGFTLEQIRAGLMVHVMGKG